jgi:hypothetical protein
MAGNSTRSFAIPSSSCNIPSTATAYSLNITVVPVGGLSYLTIWPSGIAQPVVSTLNSNGAIVANAAIVPAANVGGAVSVFVTDPTHVILDIDGYFVAQTALSSVGASIGLGSGTSAQGQNNTAIGFNVLQNNSPSDGVGNTGVGAYALASNTSGQYNTAEGALALNSNTSGIENVAFGAGAMASNTTGNENDAFGGNALGANTTGHDNTAIGSATLNMSTTGNWNTALGSGALVLLASGDSNLAVGFEAGVFLTTGSHNIEIANEGNATDSGVIRIGGGSFNQTSTFIAGISGVNPGGGGAVFITTTGQLYSPSSSARYKEEIRDMGKSSDKLLDLRPVTFRYKQPAADGTKPLEYGLIAEEVAKIYPELIVYGKDGQVESVQYHQLPALLLNEVQKQQKKIDAQESTIQLLESRLAILEQLLTKRSDTNAQSTAH